MRISVLIPTYRRPDSLQWCLDGLERQQRLPDEVLVAYRDEDHATRDLLAAMQTAYPLIAVAIGEANASEARNRCLARSTSEVIAMIDDDAVPGLRWLAAIEARFLEDETLGGLGGPDWLNGEVVPMASRPSVVGSVQWWGRRIGNHHRGAHGPLCVEWLKGANMSMRRAALAPAPFGHGLRGRGAQFAEDVALSLEVKRAGWELLYDPDVAVDHYPAALTADLDHRTLKDECSLADAAHNDTVAMLGYLTGARRAAFLVWSWLVGTRLLPGLVASGVLTLDGVAGAWRRCRTVLRGRRDGWRTWRARAGQPDDPAARPMTASPAARRYRKRICLVTHVVRPGDGQGRVNYELALHLLRHGHEVTLIASSVAPDLERQAGLTWLRVPVPERAPAPLRWGIFAVGAWWRLLRSHQHFDVVHLNGAIAPIQADVNTSHFVHAAAMRLQEAGPRRGGARNLYQRAVTAISKYFEQLAYPTAGRVVAVSEVVGASLTADLGVPGPQVKVIPLGVDSALFRPRRMGEAWGIRAELGLDRQTFLVLFVGDAKSSRKNLDLALQSVARLGDQVHLAIIGKWEGGPYPLMAERLGITGRTHFLGMRRDVAACYRDADAVFCASHYEPASLVLLEAMASGVPVISTPTVGNAVFVTDRANGFLLRSSTDTDRAVDILRALIADRSLGERIGEAARASVAGLTWDRMGYRYEQLYLELEDHALQASLVS